MIRSHAAWVLPVGEPPIRHGWVAIDGGRIAGFGSRDTPSGPSNASEVVDLGEAAVLPGLVNAHTHLELSYLRDEVGAAADFVSWIRNVMSARQGRRDPHAPDILESVDRAVAECVASGTAIVGDISNTLVPFDRLVRSQLAAVVFYELIRFKTPDPAGFVEDAWRRIRALQPTDRVRASLAAHAPYSVAPLVFKGIRQAIDRDPGARCSVHLSESVEEIEFVRDGTGPWRELLVGVGAWDPSWVAPGVSPVQFLDESRFLDSRVLAVHGVQMTLPDLRRLAARGTTLVTCPRSNRFTGAGDPPIADFYASEVRVAVGTDSLASSPDLNVFAELKAMRALAPSVPPSRLLESATLQGARALGFDDEYGTIAAGKMARLIAVDVPARTGDVEEYLVSGIQPGQLRWIQP